ncbi:MAG: NADH-quinone oxidoreductase subunit N [Opitutaceae bacterium]|jgi:NADH-quinone oxidoreductase subunit N
MTSFLQAFLPELVMLAGALGLFVVALGEGNTRGARTLALFTALAAVLACVVTRHSQAVLFDGAYRVDAFSQWLKLVISAGFAFLILLGAELPDIRKGVKPEYFLFLTLSITGLITLVSCIDVIALVIALELSSFPLYIMVAMRREREGHRVQMESAIKYIMFGVAANGIMFFGLSYLYGLTGSTSLPVMMTKLQPLAGSPLAVVGLAMAFAGIYYKLAIFPFHFWTPDVYQGASNETAGLIASLPKLGAMAVFVRFVSLSTQDNPSIVALLSILAVASMLYGNLIALVQKDFKRLLGFSSIAHAGYGVVGFAALSAAGYTASLYYITGYVFMILACFLVISRVSADGGNVAISDLAGLHRRSPLLALTLLVAVFSLAGVPPFVGFMGKFSILSAALAKGHVSLVVIMVINTAIAVYYYLRVVKEAVFGDPVEQAPIVLDLPTRALCVSLIAAIVLLGVAPAKILATISASLSCLGL